MTEKKDLLLFQIGPVQEFITAARTLDDLWSGSYMIAFLTSSGIKRLCELVGDDAVVFPCLKGQTVYERVWRDGPLGQPTIPNRFCAEVAHERVKCVAGEIKNAILGKFADMSEACFRKFLELFPRSGMSYRKRWDSQVRSFLQISWQSVPLDPGDWGGELR